MRETEQRPNEKTTTITGRSAARATTLAALAAFASGSKWIKLGGKINKEQSNP